jgi:uncharacterized protein (TIGR03437 family)
LANKLRLLGWGARLVSVRTLHRLPNGRGSERKSHVRWELQSRDRKGVGAFDKFFRAALFLVFCIPAGAQIAIVSAASYRPLVAPNSLATIFGTRLANSTATAQLDSNHQLPTQLAGVTVQINGTAASLLYVSAGQINFLVPAGTVLGTAQVAVQPSPGAAQIQTTMQVGIVAPGLFSADATGSGPGAILNATTFTGPPFLVETPQNTGADKRTRLAVFATGLRYAGNPSQNPDQTNVAIHVQARDSSGTSYDVEYAGSAPGFFGLDQINLLLPAEADGAGAISLAIAAGDVLSNTVTFNMGSIPDSAVHLNALMLTPPSIIAGNDISGTVSLNARARFGGYNVSLASDTLGVTTPLSVLIPQGQTSGTFTAHTSSLSNNTVTVTATSGNFSESASVVIYPVNTPQLTRLSLGVVAIQGGASVTGTLSLSGNVGLGGATVNLTSSNPTVVQVPATVALSFGQSSASINISTAGVSAQQSATITATFAGSTSTATLIVNPVLTIMLSPAAVVGGTSATGTVSLAQAPTTPATVMLQSSDSKAASVPASAIVPAGQLSASFTVSTSNVTAPLMIVITGTYANASQSATLTVNPSGLPTPVSLTLNPLTVQGGNTSIGTVTISAPAPTAGLVVDLTTDNPFVSQIPSFVVVTAGQTVASFTIATPTLSASQTATITASAGGVSQSATLTVQ